MKIKMYYQSDPKPLSGDEKNMLLFYPEKGLSPEKQIGKAFKIIEEIDLAIDSIIVATYSPYFAEAIIKKFENRCKEHGIEYAETDLEYYVDDKFVGHDGNCEYWKLFAEPMHKIFFL